MNNYYGQHENQYNRQGFYKNTYSLWQNSQYYDTSNLSLTNNVCNEGHNFVSMPQETTPSTTTDNQNTTGETVSMDPNIPDNVYNQSKISATPIQNSAMLGWPQQSWVKAGDSTADAEQSTSEYFRHATSSNKLEMRLNKALKKPVKTTKAESIMQKMGWQGGALGKTGDGILEPIAPNAVYATSTAGLGHCNQIEEQKRQPKQQPRQQPKQQLKQQLKKQKSKKQQQCKQNGSENKQQFYTDVLYRILMFVRNDFEVEMSFDKSMWKGDRKRIHNLVEEVIGSDSPEDAMYADEVQTDLLRQIQHYNSYVISTQSHGEPPDRQLNLYKEAPAHVFLIIPDDLREKEIEDEPSDLDVDESNPFLKSILKNLKDKDSNTLEMRATVKANLDKIIAYFEEFHKDHGFTEFRFLGPFDFDEIEAINTFLNEVNKCIASCYVNVSEKLVKLFEGSLKIFQVQKDANGNAVIYKVNIEQE